MRKASLSLAVKPSAPVYFPALTGIRAVAASMIFLVHFNPFKASLFGKPVHAFVGELHVGVTLFFVLSGFLICYRYKDAVYGKKYWFRNYMVRRAGRIYPMYFLATVLAFLPFVCHCSFRNSWNVILLNLSFLRGFFDEYKFTGAPAGWSLTPEEMFYLLFPLMIFYADRIRLIIQPLLFLLFGLLLWLVFRNINFHGFFSNLQFLFEFTFFGRCVEFYTGVLLAIAVKSQPETVPPKKGYRLTMAGLCWIVSCVALLAANRLHFKTGGYFLLFETLLNNFILPPGIALLFYGLVSERSFLRKILESVIFVQLGKSSYVFYLIHNGPLFAFLYFSLHKRVELVFILTHAIAWILYRLVERPCNRHIRRIFTRGPSAGTNVPS